MGAARTILEVGATVAVAVVALAVGGTYLWDRHASRDLSVYEASREIPGWEEANLSGIRRGPADAPYVLTEFIDFECPFCARLAPTIDSLMADYPEEVAVVFQHFPLTGHPNALPAAIVAECAERQGAFWSMYRALLAGQDGFGSEPWEAFAIEADVNDIEEFSRCIELPADSFPRIGLGSALAAETGATGTPTVWLNGRVVNPNLQSVREVIEDR
jgi:protein-disulfide isomerase